MEDVSLRRFAYAAHTSCDTKGIVQDAEVMAGNSHGCVAWNKVYNKVTDRFGKAEFIKHQFGIPSQ